MAHKIDFPPPPKIKQQKPINTTKTINNIIVIDSSKIGGSTPINQPNILSPIPTIQNLQPIITPPKIQTPPSPPITIYPIINNIKPPPPQPQPVITIPKQPTQTPLTPLQNPNLTNTTEQPQQDNTLLYVLGAATIAILIILQNKNI